MNQLRKSIGVITMLTLVGVFGFGLVTIAQEECGEDCKKNQVEIACSKINTGVMDQYNVVDTKHRRFSEVYNTHFSLLEFDVKKLSEINVDNQEILVKLSLLGENNKILTSVYDSLTREVNVIRLGCGEGEITLQTIKFKKGIEDYDEFLAIIKSDLIELKKLIENI